MRYVAIIPRSTAIGKKQLPTHGATTCRRILVLPISIGILGDRGISRMGVSVQFRCGCPLGGSGGRQSRLRICERARSAIRVGSRGLLPCMYIATARPAQIQ
jgi:hypothetical protein